MEFPEKLEVGMVFEHKITGKTTLVIKAINGSEVFYTVDGCLDKPWDYYSVYNVLKTNYNYLPNTYSEITAAKSGCSHPTDKIRKDRFFSAKTYLTCGVCGKALN